MNSKIPTFSVKKPTVGQSRLAPPSTIKRPSSFLPNNKLNAASTVKSSAMGGLRKPTQLATGIKRPLDNPGGGGAFMSVNKFKRATPLSLARSTSKEALKPPASVKVAARLDFSDNFRTPLVNRNPVPAPDKGSDENETLMVIRKAGKPETDTKSTSPIVDWKTLTKESEMISYKVKMSALQKHIDELNCENSQLRIRSTVNEEKVKNETNEAQRKIKELNNQINSFKDKEDKLKSEMKETENLIIEKENCYEKAKLKYENEINDLKSKLDDVRSREQSTRTELSTQIVTLQHEVNRLNADLMYVSQEKDVLASNFEEVRLQEQELQTTRTELETAKNTIARLEEDLKSYEEGSKLQSVLEGELSQLRSTKDENILLKHQLDLLSDVKSENMILNEKIIGLESEVECLKNELTRKNVDVAELSYSKNRLQEWMEIVGADMPDMVVGKITDLNQEVSLLRVENESLKSELKIKTQKLSNEVMTCRTKEEELTKAKDTIKILSEQLQTQRRNYKLLMKEHESLKSLNQSKPGTSEATSKIAELESLLAEYKQSMAKQEGELINAKNEAARLQGNEREIELLKSEIARIKELNPHIYTAVSPLDVSTLQTNEKEYRVFHLKHNPVAIKIDESKRQHAELEEENRRLLEENRRFRKLVETVERTGDSADLTRQVDESSKLQMEVVKLQNLYSRSSADLEKLKETYRNMTRKFRTACYRLTGFQIDNLSDTRYRLKHQYEKDQCELIFEVVDRRVQIQDCSAAQNLQEEIQTYLVEHSSCPAFLAAYTMQLFKRKTLF